MVNTPGDSGNEPSNNEREKKELYKGLYPALVNLVIHGQENKLQTLNLYLLFNSIIIVAWATLFSATPLILTVKIACTLFCSLGILLAIIWMPLGWDYANASDHFSKSAECLENNLPECIRTLQERAKQKEQKLPIGSRMLLFLVPIFFLLAYVVLLVLVWVRCN